MRGADRTRQYVKMSSTQFIDRKAATGSRLVHEHVREDLRSRFVLTGAHGDRIPPERVLAKQFGVAPLTISRALQELQNEGLLDRIPGRGTFIRRNVPSENSSSAVQVAETETTQLSLTLSPSD